MKHCASIMHKVGAPLTYLFPMFISLPPENIKIRQRHVSGGIEMKN